LAQVPEETVIQNSHPYNPPISLFPALDNMKVETELMAGLGILGGSIILYRKMQNV
jgi:hypothetical protein